MHLPLDTSKQQPTSKPAFPVFHSMLNARAAGKIDKALFRLVIDFGLTETNDKPEQSPQLLCLADILYVQGAAGVAEAPTFQAASKSFH